jgi:hypothetical protein
LSRGSVLVALGLGIGGLIPILASAAIAVGSNATWAPIGAKSLLAYSATTLALLGGIQWGFALRRAPVGPEADGRDHRSGLVLGAIVHLIAWAALLIPLFIDTLSSLLILIGGFVFAMLGEARAADRGLLPPRLLTLRWVQTLIIVVVLGATVLITWSGGHLVF